MSKMFVETSSIAEIESGFENIHKLENFEIKLETEQYLKPGL